MGLPPGTAGTAGRLWHETTTEFLSCVRSTGASLNQATGSEVVLLCGGPIGLDGPKGEPGRPGDKGSKGEVGAPPIDVFQTVKLGQFGSRLRKSSYLVCVTGIGRTRTQPQVMKRNELRVDRAGWLVWSAPKAPAKVTANVHFARDDDALGTDG
uniref:Uncharacterized protein n=1 Tax=Anopheles farauti TaxID=69004 RepID=A0A182QMW0_9DIPT